MIFFFLQCQKDASASFPSPNSPSTSRVALTSKSAFLLVFLQGCPQLPSRASLPKAPAPRVPPGHQDTLYLIQHLSGSPRRQVDWGAIRIFCLLYRLSSAWHQEMQTMCGMLIASSQGAQVTTFHSLPRDPIPPSISMSSINPQEEPLRTAGLQDTDGLCRLHTMPVSLTGSSAMLPIS